MNTLLVYLAVVTTVAHAYPEVKTSFRAVGNIYVGNRQIAFEENFETGAQRSAFTTIEAGINATVLDYHRPNEAFLFTGNNSCYSLPTIDEKFLTDIKMVRTDESGLYVTPIHQLLSLNTSYLRSPTPTEIYESGITKNRWTFDIKQEAGVTLEIQADWTGSSTVTASAKAETPLSFTINRSTKDSSGALQITTQKVSVDLFLHGEINRQVFRARRGVYCPKFKQSETHFETAVKRLKGLRTKVEQVIKEYSQVGVVDTWFDPGNELYKINFSPIREQVKNGVQRIISHVQGVVYEMSQARKCVVKEVKEKANFDPETIFNPFNKGEFSVEGFFGLNKADYKSIGEDIVRGVPCNVYQGLRSDWPPEQGGDIKSLWEWCLANEAIPGTLQMNGFPLISLNIYIQKSPYAKDQHFYYQGLKLAYNFYEVQNNTKEYLDNLAFDIQECFEDANQKRLEFRAKVKEEATRKLLARNERHQEHVAKWTEAIVKAAKLRAASLRVASVQTSITEDELEVRFVLLGRHPDLPPTTEEISLDEASDNVKTTLDNNQLEVTVEMETKDDTKTVNLKGEPGTLKQMIIEDEKNSKGTGVSAGVMAGVAVVMLAVGAAVGAAVIFQRKRKMYQRV